MILMEGAVSKQLLSHGNHIFYYGVKRRCCRKKTHDKKREKKVNFKTSKCCCVESHVRMRLKILRVCRSYKAGSGFAGILGTQSTRCCIQTPFVKLRPGSTAGHIGSSVDLGFPKVTRHTKLHVKMFAIRRRRAYLQTDTYLLMEPGKSEEFVSEEELKAKLKGWLENWPGDALPPDLARFKTTDDAVSHLVKSVCELEIDGEIGTIQWYEVRLE